MEVSPWFIYLCHISIGFIWFFCVLFVAAVCACLGCCITLFLEADNHKVQKQIYKRNAYRFGILALVFFITAILIPDRETLIAMKVVPAVTNSRVVQKIPEALEKFIDKYIEENK